MDEEERLRKIQAGREKLAAFKRKKLRKKKKKTDSQSLDTESEMSDVTDSETSSVIYLTDSEQSSAGERSASEDEEHQTSVSLMKHSKIVAKLKDAMRHITELEETIFGKDQAMDNLFKENQQLKTQLSANVASQDEQTIPQTLTHVNTNQLMPMKEAFEKKIAELEKALHEKDKTIEELSGNLQAVTENRDLLQAEYVEQASQLSQQVHTLQEQLKQTSEWLEKPTGCGVPFDVLLEAKNELLALHASNKEKDQQLILLQEMVRQRDHTIMQLQAESCDKLEVKVKLEEYSLLKEKQSHYEQNVAHLERELASLRQTNQENICTIERLKLDLERVHSKEHHSDMDETYRAELLRAKEEMSELYGGMITRLKGELKQVTDERNRFSAQVNTWQRQYLLLSEQNISSSDLSAQIGMLTTENMRYREQVESLQHQIEELVTEKDDALTKLESSNAGLRHLETQLKCSQCARLKEEINELNFALKQARDETHNYKLRVEELETKISAAQHQLETINSEHQKELDEWIRKYSELNSTLEKIRQEHTTVIGQYENKLTEEKQQHEVIQQQLSVHYQQQVELLKQEHQNIINIMSQQLEETMKTNSEKHELTMNEQQNQTQQDLISQLKADQVKALSKIKHLQCEKDEIKQQLDLICHENSELKSNLAQLNNENSEMKSRLSQASIENSELKSCFMQVNQQRQMLEKAIESLKSDHQEVLKRLSSEHQDQIERMMVEHQNKVQTLTMEHQKSVQKIVVEHENRLQMEHQNSAQNLNSEHRETGTRLSAEQQNVQRMMSELNDLSEKNRCLSDQVRLLEEINREQKLCTEKQAEHIAKLEHELHVSCEERDKAEVERERAEIERDETRSKFDNMQIAVQTAVEEMAMAKARCEDLEKENVLTQKKHGELQKEILSLKAENSEMKQTIQTLYQEQEKIVTALEKKLEISAEEKKQLRSSLEESLAKLSEENMILRENMEKLENKLEQAAECSEGKNDWSKEEYEAQLARLQEERDDMERELGHMRCNATGFSFMEGDGGSPAASSPERQIVQQELSATQQQLEASEEQLAELSPIKNVDYEHEVERLRQRLSEALMRIEQLEDEKSVLIEQNEREVGELLDKMATMLDDEPQPHHRHVCDDSCEHVKEVTQQLDQSRSQLDRVVVEAEQLREEHEKALGQMASAHEKTIEQLDAKHRLEIVELTRQVTELKRTITQLEAERTQLEADRTQLDLEYENELCRVTAEHENRIRQIGEMHEREMEELKVEMSRTCTKLAEEQEAARVVYVEEVTCLKQQLQDGEQKAENEHIEHETSEQKNPQLDTDTGMQQLEQLSVNYLVSQLRSKISENAELQNEVDRLVTSLCEHNYITGEQIERQMPLECVQAVQFADETNRQASTNNRQTAQPAGNICDVPTADCAVQTTTEETLNVDTSKLISVIEEEQSKCISLQSELEKKDKEISKLQAQYDAITNGQNDATSVKYEELVCKYDQLGKQHEDLTHKHSELKKENEELLCKHDELNKQHEDLVCKHDELSKQHEDLECKYDELHKQHEDLLCKHDEINKQHVDLMCKHSELRKQNEDLLQTCDGLRKQHDNLVGKHEMLSKQHEELVHKHCQLCEQYDDKQNEEASVMKSVTEERKHECVSLQSEIEMKDSQLSTVREQLEELVCKYDEACKRCRELEKENHGLLSKCDELDKLYSELVHKHNELSKQHDEQLCKHQELSKKYEELQCEYHQTSTQHDEIIQQHDELKKKHEDSILRQNEFVKQYDELHHKHEQLLHSHDELCKQHKEHVYRHQQLCEQHESLMSKHSDLEKQHVELVCKHDQVCAEHSELTCSHSKLEEDHQRLVCKHEELSKHHEDLVCKHEEISKQYEDLQCKHKVLNHELEDLQCKHEELSKQHEDLQEKHKVLSQQHKELLSKHDETRRHCDELRKKFDKLSTENGELVCKHTELLKQHEELFYKNNQLSEQYGQLKEQMSAMKSVTEEGRQNSAYLQSELELKDKQLHELRKQHQEFVSKYEELTKQNEDIVCKHTQLSIQHEEMTKQHEDLVCKHDVLSKQLEEFVNKYEELSIQNEDLVCKHSQLSNQHEELSKEHKDLVCKHNALSNQHDELVSKYEEVIKQNEDLVDNQAELNRQHDELSKHYKELLCKHDELGKQHEELAGKYDNLDKDHQGLVYKHSDVCKQNEELMHKHTELGEQHKELGCKHNVLCEQHKKLQKLLESGLSDIRQDLSTAKFDVQKMQREFGVTLTNVLEKLISTLRQQQADNESRIDMVMAEKGDLERKYENLKTEQKNYVDKCEVLSEEKTALEIQQEGLLKQLQIIRESYTSETQTMVESVQKELMEIQSTNDELKIKTRQLEETNEKLKAENKDLQKKSTAEKITVDRLMDQIKQLEDEAAAVQHELASKQSELETSAAVLREKEHLIEQLKEQLKESQSSEEKLNQMIAEVTEERNKLLTKFDSSLEEKAELEAAEKPSTGASTLVEEMNAEKDQRISELRVQLDLLSSEKHQLEEKHLKEITVLNERLEQVLCENEHLHAEVEQLKADKEKTNEELKIQRQQMEALSRQLQNPLLGGQEQLMRENVEQRHRPPGGEDLNETSRKQGNELSSSVSVTFQTAQLMESRHIVHTEKNTTLQELNIGTPEHQSAEDASQQHETTLQQEAIARQEQEISEYRQIVQSYLSNMRCHLSSSDVSPGLLDKVLNSLLAEREALLSNLKEKGQVTRSTSGEAESTEQKELVVSMQHNPPDDILPPASEEAEQLDQYRNEVTRLRACLKESHEDLRKLCSRVEQQEAVRRELESEKNHLVMVLDEIRKRQTKDKALSTSSEDHQLGSASDKLQTSSTDSNRAQASSTSAHQAQLTDVIQKFEKKIQKLKDQHDTEMEVLKFNLSEAHRLELHKIRSDLEQQLKSDYTNRLKQVESEFRQKESALKSEVERKLTEELQKSKEELAKKYKAMETEGKGRELLLKSRDQHVDGNSKALDSDNRNEDLQSEIDMDPETRIQKLLEENRFLKMRLENQNLGMQESLQEELLVMYNRYEAVVKENERLISKLEPGLKQDQEQSYPTEKHPENERGQQTVDSGRCPEGILNYKLKCEALEQENRVLRAELNSIQQIVLERVQEGALSQTAMGPQTADTAAGGKQILDSCAVVERQFVTLHTELEGLKSLLDRDREIKEVRQDCIDLTASKDNLQQENSEMLVRHHELQIKYQELQKEYNDVVKKCQDLQSKNEQLQSKEQELCKKDKELVDKYEELIKELEDLKVLLGKSKDKSKKDYIKMKAKYVALAKENDLLKVKVRELEKELQKDATSIKDGTTSHEKGMISNESNTSGGVCVYTDKERVESDAIVYKDDKTCHSSTNKDASTSASQIVHWSDYEKLKQQYSELLQETVTKKTLEANYNDLVKKHAELRTTMERQAEKLNTKIRRLENEVQGADSKTKQKMDSERQKYDAILKKLKDTEQTLSTYQEKCFLLEEQLACEKSKYSSGVKEMELRLKDEKEKNQILMQEMVSNEIVVEGSGQVQQVALSHDLTAGSGQVSVTSLEQSPHRKVSLSDALVSRDISHSEVCSEESKFSQSNVYSPDHSSTSATMPQQNLSATATESTCTVDAHVTVYDTDVQLARSVSIEAVCRALLTKLEELGFGHLELQEEFGFSVNSLLDRQSVGLAYEQVTAYGKQQRGGSQSQTATRDQSVTAEEQLTAVGKQATVEEKLAAPGKQSTAAAGEKLVTDKEQLGTVVGGEESATSDGHQLVTNRIQQPDFDVQPLPDKKPTTKQGKQHGTNGIHASVDRTQAKLPIASRKQLSIKAKQPTTAGKQSLTNRKRSGQKTSTPSKSPHPPASSRGKSTKESTSKITTEPKAASRMMANSHNKAASLIISEEEFLQIKEAKSRLEQELNELRHRHEHAVKENARLLRLIGDRSHGTQVTGVHEMAELQIQKEILLDEKKNICSHLEEMKAQLEERILTLEQRNEHLERELEKYTATSVTPPGEKVLHGTESDKPADVLNANSPIQSRLVDVMSPNSDHIADRSNAKAANSVNGAAVMDPSGLNSDEYSSPEAVQELIRRIQELQAGYKSIQSKYAEQSNACVLLENDNKSMRDELSALKADLKKVVAENQRLLTDIHGLESEISIYKSQAARLHSDIDKQRVTAAETGYRSPGLSPVASSSHSLNASFMDQRSWTADGPTHQELLVQYEILMQEKKEVCLQLQEEKSKTAELLAAMKRLEVSVESLQEDISRRQKEQEVSWMQREILNTEKVQLCVQLDSITNRMEECEQSLKSMKAELEATQQEKRALEEKFLGNTEAGRQAAAKSTGTKRIKKTGSLRQKPHVAKVGTINEQGESGPTLEPRSPAEEKMYEVLVQNEKLEQDLELCLSEKATLMEEMSELRFKYDEICLKLEHSDKHHDGVQLPAAPSTANTNRGESLEGKEAERAGGTKPKCISDMMRIDENNEQLDSKTDSISKEQEKTPGQQLEAREPAQLTDFANADEKMQPDRVDPQEETK